MKEIDDLLKKAVYSQELIEQKHAASAVAYEEKILKKILIRAGMEGKIKELAFRAKETTGKASLSFAAFYDEYPTFPIYLGMRKVPYAWKVPITDLFNKFCSTPMFKAWEEFKNEAPVEDVPVGVVFDWPGFRPTQMIIHNDWNGSNPCDGHVQIWRSVGKVPNQQRVMIESLDSYLLPILQEWAI